MSLRRLLPHGPIAKWPLIILVILACAALWMAVPSSDRQESQRHLEGAVHDIEDHTLSSDNLQSTKEKTETCSSTRISARLDCHPEEGVTEERCRQRGCCWDLATLHTGTAPPCYMTEEHTPYEVSYRTTASGLEMTLQRIRLNSVSGSAMQLKLLVYHYDDDVVRIKIRSTNNEKYEPLVPPVSNAAHLRFTLRPSIKTDRRTIIVGAGPNRKPFVFHLNSLIYSTTLNQIKVRVPATMVYGLQSKYGSYFAKFTEQTAHRFYSFQAGDIPSYSQEKVPVSFGGHPFMPLLDGDNNTASGIFLLTSSSISMTLGKDRSLTFRTDGGAMDFFLFLAPTLAGVVRDYQRVVGFPAMPPRELFGIKSDSEVHQYNGRYFMSKNVTLNDLVQLAGAGEAFVLTWNGTRVSCGNSPDAHWLLDFSSPAAGTFLSDALNRTGLLTRSTRTIVLAENIHDFTDPCCRNATDDDRCPEHLHHVSPFRNLRRAYPYFQARLTYEVLTSGWKKRRALLWHKSFPGQGRFSGYWNSDEGRGQRGLTNILGEFLLYNMYGMPIYGTKPWCSEIDVSDDGENLCIKWFILAAYFPVYMKIPSPTLAVFNTTRFTFYTHCYLRPYSYTLYYKNSRFGDMVARPIVFEFQNDTKAREVERQFMFGSALLVAPIQELGTNITSVYFPEGLWYDWYNGRRIRSSGEKIYVPVNDVYKMIFQRAGTIVPIESPPNFPHRNIRLVVAPDTDQSASGEMYIDDGISINSIKRENYSIFRFTFVKNHVTGYCSPCNYPGSETLTAVTLFSMKSFPRKAFLNGNPVKRKKARTTMFVKGYSHPMVQPFAIHW
ncbi:sucrase-isomaltase, intestinal-like [Ornithodoros turicata]|uniref:sucrase-isomaltase, intestinal-like n=1 Tax=Ornithodoros turicata TaxID=34597 RepID=UPI00313A4359